MKRLAAALPVFTLLLLAFASMTSPQAASKVRHVGMLCPATCSGIDAFWRSFVRSHYVDRILKGAKPAELPIEKPSKYERVINLKSAKSVGVEVPASLLARAGEVIE